jgi:hypothetical protein
MLNMHVLNKSLAFTLVFLVLSSLFVLTVTSTTVQATSKPVVPQFTVKLVDKSRDVPSNITTVIDPYTGKETTISNPGYRVIDRSIEVTIKNQPFTSYTDANNWVHKLRYRIQFKGHFEENWGTFPQFQSEDRIVPWASEYTVINSSPALQRILNGLEAGSQLDFRVEAINGYMDTFVSANGMPVGEMFIDDISSGWSSTQTITIPDGTVSSSPPSVTSDDDDDGNSQPQFPSQTQSPNSSIFTNPLFTWGVGVLLGGVVVAVMMMVFLKKYLKTSTAHANDFPSQANIRTALSHL